MDRLTASWMTSTQSLDADLAAGLDKLRQRSRDMVQNNEYAVRFLAMVRANVVGPQGFRLQCRVEDRPGVSDNQANAAIEQAWMEWSKYGVCDIGGRHSLVSALHACANMLAQDGEVLIRLHYGSRARNAAGFAFQLLDPSRIATQLNRDPSEGVNAIVMGVEMDDTTRPVAYWLRPKIDSQHAVRIDGSEIIHRYLPTGPEQTRGIPWMHAAIRRLHDLGGYREAAIIAARIGASKMGFYTVSPDIDPASLGDGLQPDGVPYASAEPGEFGLLPQGVSFENFNPDYPHDQFDAFIKAALRGIAAGLGVSYHGLSNDLTEVSFSSIRSGTLEERDQWRVLQDWFSAAVLEPIYREWLRMSILSGVITLPSGAALPATKFDKFLAHTWQPRTWEWVDPESDANAIRIRLETGLTTLSYEAAKSGLDLEEILQTLAREREMFAKYGIERPGTETAAPAKSAKPMP